MTKRKLIVFLLILVLFVMSYVVLNRDSFFIQKKNDPYEISVICRGQNTEVWTTIKQGIDQAAEDLNVDVSFITLSRENSASEQISLLSREVDNGANAVVIAPVDSSDLKRPLESAMKKIPVIAMQSTVSGMKDLPVISCDNAQMGRSLAQKLVKNEKGGKVVILRNGAGGSNVTDSYRGAVEELQNCQRQVSSCGIPDDTTAAYAAAKQLFLKNPDSIYIALDGETLEAVAKAKKDLGKQMENRVKLYGIGRTNTVVSLLDEKTISAVAVDNDYNIGYLCIKSAVDRINQNGSEEKTNVNFLVVDRTHMYDSESERMLFPFVR